jgi:hypothetical protein
VGRRATDRTVEDVELIDPICPASVCCIGCFTSAAFGCFARFPCARNARVREAVSSMLKSFAGMTAPKW